MHATIQCICGKHLDADAQQPGDRAQCPACSNVFVIGAPLKATAIQAGTPTIKNTQFMDAPQAIAPLDLRSTDQPSGFAAIDKPLLAAWVGIAVIVILGVWYLMQGAMVSTQDDIASCQVRGPLTNACANFRMKYGRLPKALTELLEQNANGGPYLENPDALIDPWGQPYQYDINGPMNNGAKPDIWTVSPNTVAKIGNWPRR